MADKPVALTRPTAQRIESVVRREEARGRRLERAGYGMPYVDAGTDGFFPVLVKHNGVDGDSRPKYDLYDLGDTGYVTKLNLAGALVPVTSRARFHADLTVTAAPDGTVGSAYFDTDGAIALFDPAKETLCKSGG